MWFSACSLFHHVLNFMHVCHLWLLPCIFKLMGLAFLTFLIRFVILLWHTDMICTLYRVLHLKLTNFLCYRPKMENVSNLFKLTYTLLWLICDHLSWNSILVKKFFGAYLWDLKRDHYTKESIIVLPRMCLLI